MSAFHPSTGRRSGGRSKKKSNRLDHRLLAYYLNWAQTRFWLIPTTLCATALLAALLCLYLDRNVESLRNLLPSLVLDSDAARSLMGIVATSVISVGGVSFSITMVALSLTSGQYGPKVLRHFLSSVSSKISLGLFFSTALFAVTVFIGIGEGDIPRLSVLASIGLAGASLLEFMRFVHRTTSDLQADKIIQRLGNELTEHLCQLVDTDRQGEPDRCSGTAAWRKAARGKRRAAICSDKSGYVQTIDYAGLVQLLEDSGATALLMVRPGDFLIPNQHILSVWSEDEKDLEFFQENTVDIITTGEIRTAADDPQFPITQIQQIAARALSPGVNDPGTAISCIDSLTQALAQIADAEFPGAVLCDSEEQPRLVTPSARFDALIDLTFSPLRIYIDNNLPVANCLLRSLSRLADSTSYTERLEVLCRQAALVVESMRKQELHDFDMRELERGYQRLCRR